ncbi:hypothetical protein LINPERPRIM_LOCUS36711 [Linum perenne]
MGTTQVQNHPSHLLHHKWCRHARRRLPAHQAPRSPSIRQANHDVPTRLLRRRHRPPPR